MSSNLEPQIDSSHHIRMPNHFLAHSMSDCFCEIVKLHSGIIFEAPLNCINTLGELSSYLKGRKTHIKGSWYQNLEFFTALFCIVVLDLFGETLVSLPLNPIENRASDRMRV
jgi:hypothetical protein